MSAEHTRLNVNLNDECARFIRTKQDHGQTATETIRRAVTVYGYIETMRSLGARLVLEDADGTRQELVLL